MAFVSMSDLNSLCSELDGLSDDGFVIYPNVQEALKQPQAYGFLYREGDQVKMTGPYGPLIVKSTTVHPTAQAALQQPGSYGYIYVENGRYLLSGPAGPLEVRSPYVKGAAPGASLFSLPPLPTTKIESPAALPPPAAGQNTGFVPPNDPMGPATPHPAPTYASAEPAVSPLILVAGVAGLAAVVGLVLLVQKKKRARAARKAAEAKAAAQARKPEIEEV